MYTVALCIYAYENCLDLLNGIIQPLIYGNWSVAMYLAMYF